jgi:hypothetical protein
MLSNKMTWVVLVAFALSAVPVILVRHAPQDMAARPAMMHLLDRR